MNEIELNEKDWKEAAGMAMDVEFLEGEEYMMYAKVIYDAIQWGKTVK